MNDLFPSYEHVQGIGVTTPDDAIWGVGKRYNVPPYLPDSDSQNRTVLSAVLESARMLASSGYEVFVDGIVLPKQLRPILESFRNRQVAGQILPCKFRFIILRPSEETTLKRADQRILGLRDHEIIRGLDKQFLDIGDCEWFTLDSTDRPPEETADLVFHGINKLLFEFDIRLSTTGIVAQG